MIQPALHPQPFLPVLIDNSPERELDDIQPGDEPPEDVTAGDEPDADDDEKRADADSA